MQPTEECNYFARHGVKFTVNPAVTRCLSHSVRDRKHFVDTVEGAAVAAAVVGVVGMCARANGIAAVSGLSGQSWAAEGCKPDSRRHRSRLSRRSRLWTGPRDHPSSPNTISPAPYSAATPAARRSKNRFSSRRDVGLRARVNTRIVPTAAVKTASSARWQTCGDVDDFNSVPFLGRFRII